MSTRLSANCLEGYNKTWPRDGELFHVYLNMCTVSRNYSIGGGRKFGYAQVQGRVDRVV